MKARKAKFKVDFLEGEYEGYVFDSPSDTWNGHACPYLTYQAREQFIEDIGASAPEMTDTEDGEMMLFPVGVQQLKWEEVK